MRLLVLRPPGLQILICKLDYVAWRRQSFRKLSGKLREKCVRLQVMVLITWTHFYTIPLRRAWLHQISRQPEKLAAAVSPFASWTG